MKKRHLQSSCWLSVVVSVTMRYVTQKQPRRNHRTFLSFLFPSSLLAFLFLFFFLLLLLLLLARGKGGLITHRPRFSPHQSVGEALPRSQIPIPILKVEQVADNNGSAVARAGHGGSKRVTPKRNRALVRMITAPDARARLFSAGAEEFLRGCRQRFFMTWISPLGTFGRREMLGMESLFRFHPDGCLLFLSTSMDSPAGVRLLRPFVDLGYKVTAMSPDYSALFNDTPAAGWFDRLRRGEVKPGDISIGQNLSNLLRLAVLYRYGGTYVDTDVIFLKSFHGLRNVIGAQAVNETTGRWTRLNNAVLVFDRNHPLLREFMSEFALTFDGSKWGHNGPYLVSRVVARVRPGLYDFAVLPREAFYPVGWRRIDGLFHGPRGGEHSKWIDAKLRSLRERSFAVHLWNRQSKNQVVQEGSLISQLIADACIFCNSSNKTISSAG